MPAVLGLGGCYTSPAPQAAVPPPAAGVEKPAVAGVLASALGKGLQDDDRQIAFDAQVAALEKGQKQTWKGKRGAFGFVEPGAESVRSEGACREYSHKIYIAGRPQAGQGVACRNPAGNWVFLS